MKLQNHCDVSRTLFGETGKEYHEWLDQFSKGDGKHEHRVHLHNREGIELCVKKFGERARKHLEQHLRDDENRN